MTEDSVQVAVVTRRDKLRVLLIEDSPIHRQLVESQLEPASNEIELESAETLTQGLRHLSERRFDAVLLDLLLPDSDGIDTLWKTLAHSEDVAIVVLTSLDDEELAREAVQRGAQDYLGKEWITSEVLVRSIRHSVERKRLHSSVQTYAENLQRNHEDLQQFAAAATQRLRAPLRRATETYEALLEKYRDQLDEGINAQIADALAGIGDMQRLIEDFAVYSQIELAPPGGSGPATSSAEVLRTVCDMLRAEIQQSGATLTHDELPVVGIEQEDLILLFRDLIDNAIKYRRDEPLCVHVGAQRDGEGWRFSVRDNGTGIDSDYPGQIFEAFQVLEGSGGSGLGLALCRRIVEKYGGRIWVESEWGSGSNFQFTTPGASASPSSSRANGPDPES